MKQVIFISHYLPPAYKAGGPISVIRAIIDGPYDLNNMVLLGSNEELGEVELPAKQLSDHDSKYTSLNRKNSYSQIISFLFRYRREIRVIYINSLFDKRYAIAPLLIGVILRKAIFVSPRGEVHPPALRHNSLQKKIYMRVLRWLNHVANFQWIISSVDEFNYLQKVLPISSEKIHIVNDPIPIIEDMPRKPRRSETTPFVLSVGRITQIKNHLFVLDVLNSLNYPVIWRVAGVIEDQELFERLLSEVEKSENITFEYLGSLPYDEVLNVMRDSDVLFNPSLSESFGYVFVEAFGCGLPVLTSDGVPWKKLEALGIGGNYSLEDKKEFQSALQKILNVKLAPQSSKKCRQYYEKLVAEQSPQKLIDILNSFV